MQPQHTMPDYDLFVSYSPADREWVEGYLLDALSAANVRVLSELNFALGAPRIVEFERAIKNSKRTLLVLSPAYMAEAALQFVDLMVQFYGLESGTWPVIPLLRAHGVDPAALYAQRKQYVVDKSAVVPTISNGPLVEVRRINLHL